MKINGHEFLIMARDKEITLKLLDNYKIPYKSRGAGGKTLFSKVMYIPEADQLIYKEAKKFLPDIFLSFASTYAAHVSKLMGKPHIALDDTEHAKFELFMYTPFTDTILNPNCFSKNLGQKQILLNFYTELLYLHPNYFKPNAKILQHLNVSEQEEYAIVRFISWEASHDFKERGLTNDEKIELVESLAGKMKVFVSSEGILPEKLLKYQFNVSPEFMHDALYYARIYIGEGGTTASESAILGTPAVYINNLTMGYIEEEKKAGLLIQSTNKSEIMTRIDQMIQDRTREEYRIMATDLIKNKIDITAFLAWFVENYPESLKKIKEDPQYQYEFR